MIDERADVRHVKVMDVNNNSVNLLDAPEKSVEFFWMCRTEYRVLVFDDTLLD